MTKQKQAVDRPAPRRVPLSTITTDTDTFQFREGELDEWHVQSLTAVLKRGEELPAIPLWHNPETGALVVIDGHHRREAYRRAKWAKRVPVLVHRCSLHEARLLALKDNAKTQKPMTGEERANAAWRLVCFVENGKWVYGRAKIAAATGRSDGGVAEMRRTFTKLTEMGEELPASWWHALQLVNGRERGPDHHDDDRDAWVEAERTKLDDKVGKDIGVVAALCPEAVAAMVVGRVRGDRLAVIVAYLREHVAESEDDEDEFDPLEAAF